MTCIQTRPDLDSNCICPCLNNMRFYAAGLVLTAALVAAVVADRWPRPRDQPVEPTPGNAIDVDSALLQRILGKYTHDY